MKEYYDRRAPEYEAIYRRDDPVRQREQAALSVSLEDVVRGRRVLEVACGTGFWTEVAARVARHVVAVDVSSEMLAVARSKGLPAGIVRFRLGDAWALDRLEGHFDAGLANFWLSHVARARIGAFLDGFHRRLARGAGVFMADNVDVPGLGGERVRPAGSGDTYKIRRLSDGSTHQVLKNYFTAEDLREILAPRSTDLRVEVGECFWWVSYRTPDSA